MKGIADGDVNFAFVPFANLAFVTVRLSTGWPLLFRRVHPTTRHASVKHACLFSDAEQAFLLSRKTAEYGTKHVQTAEYSEHCVGEKTRLT